MQAGENDDQHKEDGVNYGAEGLESFGAILFEDDIGGVVVDKTADGDGGRQNKHKQDPKHKPIIAHSSSHYYIY